ncbi:chitin deacetylase [Burkholderia sp. WAC0059]|uniref:polysaccharide deacetylase family protein n=1 Tax=Burkholderia sp. WAC0059 TaxID=2066022 RepID=UPI000C7EE6FB|nr:polysaccharide deacetylase family protein [Burkholderia sp. WAC0059]PLZ02840.1 chitin deacetylase [Burkholderia sp. WAC0059]
MTRERDFAGYGEHPPDARWPAGARIAVNLNLNFEGGGERNVADGDACSEGMLNDIGMPCYAGLRSPLSESVFEYGSRVGVWRVLDVLRQYRLKVSVLGVVTALTRAPDVLRAVRRDGHELVCHGYRWLDYQTMPLEEERSHVEAAVDFMLKVSGGTPFGWMTGRPGINTRSLIAATGHVLYDRDELNDELPYWTAVGGRPHLVVPYSYETNDNRFNENSGFSVARHFSEYMIDAFDRLYAEGIHRPAILSIGLHDRLIGRPARIRGLVDFLDYASKKPGVWFCTGADIAHHWAAAFPPPGREAPRR